MGGKLLFKELSFGIHFKERVALIAPNGSGKTTLLRILNEELLPDTGLVTFRQGLKKNVLYQQPAVDLNQSVDSLLKQSNHPRNAARIELEIAQKNLHENPGSTAEKKYHLALECYQQCEAWRFENQANELLHQLGIVDFSQLLSTLSGGQLKRIALALVLLEEPEFLILDEPSNHLDIPMMEWLEHYLILNEITVLLVTHDRYMIDRVCTRVIELDQGFANFYQGNYSYYLEKRAERMEAENARLDKARNRYRNELEWIRKMPKARGTKSKARIDAFNDLSEELSHKRNTNTLAFKTRPQRLGHKVAEFHHVGKAFGSKVLLNDFNHLFGSTDRIALLGNNGAGKSTLIKLILGQDSPDSGKIILGETARFGYFSQHCVFENPEASVIETLKHYGEVLTLEHGHTRTAAQLLMAFNFIPSQHFTPVSALSGGEQRRLHLLTVLIQNPNVLLLDEPTNDLDISTIQALEEFLDGFPGCVIFASHDRFFIDRVAQQVLAFDGTGTIKWIHGAYESYQEWLQLKSDALPRTSAKTHESNIKPTPASPKISYKIQLEITRLEHEIKELEQQLSACETELEKPMDYSKITQFTEEYAQIKTLLALKMERWMELQDS